MTEPWAHIERCTCCGVPRRLGCRCTAAFHCGATGCGLCWAYCHCEPSDRQPKDKQRAG